MEIYLDFVFKSLKNLSQVFSLCRRLSRISMDARGKATMVDNLNLENPLKLVEFLINSCSAIEIFMISKVDNGIMLG
jgi:hypothetical protein